jgi:hypothetical protein
MTGACSTAKMQYPYTSGVHIFQKSRTHRKLLGLRWVTLSRLQTEKPQILGATLQNLVARDSCTPTIHSFNCKSSREEQMNTDIRNLLGIMLFFPCERVPAP